MQKYFFSESSPSGDLTIDFEITTERPSPVAENRSILTNLRDYNSLRKSASSLAKVGVLYVTSRLKKVKAKSSDKLILGHLNISSIRNKFEALKFIIDHNIDIFLISETKLDDSFPSVQFLIKSVSPPYKFERNSKGGGLFLYIHEDIPSTSLKLI